MILLWNIWHLVDGRALDIRILLESGKTVFRKIIDKKKLSTIQDKRKS